MGTNHRLSSNTEGRVLAQGISGAGGVRVVQRWEAAPPVCADMRVLFWWTTTFAFHAIHAAQCALQARARSPERERQRKRERSET